MLREGTRLLIGTRLRNRVMDIERFVNKDGARRIKSEIRTILMRDWDPIGVKDEPMAADEYDMYLGGIYELLKSGASLELISEHLREIEIKRMGFAEFQVPQHLDVASALKQVSLT